MYNELMYTHNSSNDTIFYQINEVLKKKCLASNAWWTYQPISVSEFTIKVHAINTWISR